MPRGLAAEWIQHAGARVNRPVLLFRWEASPVTGGYLNLCTGPVDVMYGNQLYLGNGWLHDVSNIIETLELSTRTAQVSLAGVPQALIAETLTKIEHRRTGTIFLTFLNEDLSVAAQAATLFHGWFDHAEINDDATDPRIELFFYHHLADMERVKELRWNSETQKLFVQGDKGFEYVNVLSSKKIQWGVRQPKKKKEKERDKHKTGRGSRKKRS